MRCCVLMGSPRKQGNTAALLTPFLAELLAAGWEMETLWLYDMTLRPCMACRICQRDWSGFGCPQQDDGQRLFDAVLACDLLLLTTPIHSWYCTPPLKAALDRLVYGMNKYYGTEKGPSLWSGKAVALLSTCGYRPEKGTDLWESGMARYCKHSHLRLLGALAERDFGYETTFMTPEKAAAARDFAHRLLAEMATEAKDNCRVSP